MASISQFERASVARRLESLRKALCELGLLNLPMVEHTKRLPKC